MRVLFFAILFLVGCASDKKYTVLIDSMDPETKLVTEKKENVFSKDDTSAFKLACSRYWANKSVALKMNREFLGTTGYVPMPIPFFFSVETAQGLTVSFDKEEAERLTRSIVTYYNEKVIPAIDTITPLKDRPKSEPAKIY